MSYDVYLATNGGRKKDHAANYTSNVNGMIKEAMQCSLDDLHNVNAVEAKEKLEYAIKRLRKDPLKYKQMNPRNGWGNYEGVINFLEDISHYCTKYSNRKVEVL